MLHVIVDSTKSSSNRRAVTGWSASHKSSSSRRRQRHPHHITAAAAAAASDDDEMDDDDGFPYPIPGGIGSPSWLHMMVCSQLIIIITTICAHSDTVCPAPLLPLACRRADAT